MGRRTARGCVPNQLNGRSVRPALAGKRREAQGRGRGWPESGACSRVHTKDHAFARKHAFRGTSRPDQIEGQCRGGVAARMARERGKGHPSSPGTLSVEYDVLSGQVMLPSCPSEVLKVLPVTVRTKSFCGLFS